MSHTTTCQFKNSFYSFTLFCFDCQIITIYRLIKKHYMFSRFEIFLKFSEYYCDLVQIQWKISCPVKRWIFSMMHHTVARMKLMHFSHLRRVIGWWYLLCYTEYKSGSRGWCIMSGDAVHRTPAPRRILFQARLFINRSDAL